MTIHLGQTYPAAYERHVFHVVCSAHADTNRRKLGAISDARLAGPCEVCLEDEARAALSKMAGPTSILRREVRAEVRHQLVDRGLVREMTTGCLDPTPRAAGYCADPSTFEWQD
jgi:hypothetical protein